MGDDSTSSPLSDQGSPASPWATGTTRDSCKIIRWNTPTGSPCMTVLIDEQVKKLFRRVLGRSTSSAARSILAHFPMIPEPNWTASLHEALPVQYLLVALKELAVMAPHHPDLRQAVKEASEPVKIEALKYIRVILREGADQDPAVSIMAMDCFLPLGLHVPTFYPVAKGFLLDFQENPEGAMLLLKGLDGGIYHTLFSFVMFKDVVNYFRHNKIQGLCS